MIVTATEERTVLDIAGRRVGGEHFAMVAGPCTVESRDQTLQTARAVREAGATLFRGGAYKPRTSPYAFQGLGQEGLRLMAAEYILKEGNDAVMLCERGIRTFETSYRYTLDLTAVPVLRQLTHLPVIVDPSHAAGRRDLVTPLSLAAAAAGADGIIVEVHPEPEVAVCDGPQALVNDDFPDYLRRVEEAAALAG